MTTDELIARLRVLCDDYLNLDCVAVESSAHIAEMVPEIIAHLKHDKKIREAAPLADQRIGPGDVEQCLMRS